ncbi:hypothetical protein J6590_013925 [Homalodisca vitripennis]|nr:hypothetical protein J6590_013925 [Homalodisca vitripennis]
MEWVATNSAAGVACPPGPVPDLLHYNFPELSGESERARPRDCKVGGRGYGTAFRIWSVHLEMWNDR